MNNTKFPCWRKILALVGLLAASPMVWAGTPYTPLAAASAIDNRTDAWVNSQLSFREDDRTGSQPTVRLSYEANSGDEGVGDGAAKIVYSGETSASMGLSIKAIHSPRSLPASGQVILSAKLKAVAGCVKRAVLFVAEGTGEAGWHATSPPASLAPDTWTTVTVTVDPAGFTSGIHQVGVLLLGDTHDGSPDFSPAGTVYLDDFTVLDQPMFAFHSAQQLKDVGGTWSQDPSGTIGLAVKADPEAKADFLEATVHFPATIPQESGWGAGVSGWWEAQDLSRSTVVFRIYMSEELIQSFYGDRVLNSWIGFWCDKTGANSGFGYPFLKVLHPGWNTVSLDLSDAKLRARADHPSFDFSAVNGFGIGVGSNSPDMAGKTVTLRVEFVDIVPNE